MSKQAKRKSSGNDAPSQEWEFEREPDWEEIEKHLADSPELVEYEEKIRRKAALQRLLRFAAEGNWAAFQKELAEHPDLAELEGDIRKEAKLGRILNLYPKKTKRR